MGSNVIVVPALEVHISSINKALVSSGLNTNVTTQFNMPTQSNMPNHRNMQSVTDIESHFVADTFCIQTIHPTPDENHLRKVYQQQNNNKIITEQQNVQLCDLNDKEVARNNPLTKIDVGAAYTFCTVSGHVTNAGAGLKKPDLQRVMQLHVAFEELFSNLAKTGEAHMQRQTTSDKMMYVVSFQLRNEADKQKCTENLAKILQYKLQQTALHGKEPFSVEQLVGITKTELTARQEATLAACQDVLGTGAGKAAYCPWNFNCGRAFNGLSVDSQTASLIRQAAVLHKPSTYMHDSILVFAEMGLQLTQEAGSDNWNTLVAQANIMHWVHNATATEVQSMFEPIVNHHAIMRTVYMNDPAFDTQMKMQTLSADGHGGFDAHIQPVITEAQNKPREDQQLTGGYYFANNVLSTALDENKKFLQGCDCEDGARITTSYFDLAHVTTAPQYVALMNHVLTYMPADYQSMSSVLAMIATKVHTALNENNMHSMIDELDEFDTAQNIRCKIQQANTGAGTEQCKKFRHLGEACVLASAPNVAAMQQDSKIRGSTQGSTHCDLSSKTLTPAQYTSLWQTAMKNTGIAHNTSYNTPQGHCCNIKLELSCLGNLQTTTGEQNHMRNHTHKFLQVHENDVVIESTAVAKELPNDKLVHMQFKTTTPLTVQMQHMLNNKPIPMSVGMNISAALLAAELRKKDTNRTITPSNVFKMRTKCDDPLLAAVVGYSFYRTAMNVEGVNLMMVQTNTKKLQTNTKMLQTNTKTTGLSNNSRKPRGKQTSMPDVAELMVADPGRAMDRTMEKTLDVGVYTESTPLEREVCLCLGALASLQTLSMDELHKFSADSYTPLQQRLKMQVCGNQLVPVLGKTVGLHSGMVVRSKFASTKTNSKLRTAQNADQFAEEYKKLALDIHSSAWKQHFYIQQGPLNTAAAVHCN